LGHDGKNRCALRLEKPVYCTHGRLLPFIAAGFGDLLRAAGKWLREWQSLRAPTSLTVCLYLDHFAQYLILRADAYLSTALHPKAIFLILLIFSPD
jgi:hypothetical protein